MKMLTILRVLQKICLEQAILMVKFWKIYSVDNECDEFGVKGIGRDYA